MTNDIIKLKEVIVELRKKVRNQNSSIKYHKKLVQDLKLNIIRRNRKIMKIRYKMKFNLMKDYISTNNGSLF